MTEQWTPPKCPFCGSAQPHVQQEKQGITATCTICGASAGIHVWHKRALLKLEWVERQGRFASGENLVSVNVVLGYWWWDSSRPKNDETPPYAIATYLPGFKPKVTHYATTDEAKAALEAFTQRWFQRFQG